ncbi:hypothetical protein J2T13_001195 [Paenibacillus sp. DS2015]|uniref:DUF4129 domain-containing protein n=1 Tax=Paenibacillus sp. DS2015 TaxID=3373917 RepID=UPI003D206E4F
MRRQRTRSLLMIYVNSGLFALLELAVVYPLLLLLSIYVKDMNAGVVAGLMWLGSMMGKICFQWVKKRGTSWLSSIAICLAVFIAIGGLKSDWSSWIVITLVVISSLRGSSVKTWIERLPVNVQLVSLFMAVVISLFAGSSLSDGMKVELYIATLLILCSYLLNLQSRQLQTAAISDIWVSAALRPLRMINRIWMWIIILVLFIVALYNQLAEGLYWLFRSVVQWLLGWLKSGEATNVDPPQQGPIELPPMLSEETSRGGGEWLNVLIQIVAIVAIAIAAYFIGRFVWKIIRKWMGRLEHLWGVASSVMKEEAPSYVDQAEKVVIPTRRRTIFRQKDTLPDNASDQIRYYYRNMIRRAVKSGLSFSTSQTPNEVANQLGTDLKKESFAQEVTSLYNDVRYGSKKVEESEMTHIHDQWKIGK